MLRLGFFALTNAAFFDILLSRIVEKLMITQKYEDVYLKFVENYRQIHLNPWHEIGQGQLGQLHDKLVGEMDIDNDFNFYYFMNYIIKRLNGKVDAHTQYSTVVPLPLHFRVFENEVFVGFPAKLRHARLLKINGIEVEEIVKQLDDILTYGTTGARRYEIEKALMNKLALFGLPALRDEQTLFFEIEGVDGERLTKTFDRSLVASSQDIQNLYDFKYGDVAGYKFVDNVLVYRHRSIQNRFKDKIEQVVDQLEDEDLSKTSAIVVDLRGNTGGNALLNAPLMEFLKKHKDKALYCLTDYRIFSGGRYALRDLIDLGATTVGEGISTQINCFGDSHWVDADGYHFAISECYFDPFKKISIASGEEYQKLSPKDKKPCVFCPDVEVVATKEDFLADRDVVLERAIKLSKERETEN